MSHRSIEATECRRAGRWVPEKLQAGMAELNGTGTYQLAEAEGARRGRRKPTLAEPASPLITEPYQGGP